MFVIKFITKAFFQIVIMILVCNENAMATEFMNFHSGGSPVTQWVKRWPTDLADRVRVPLEVKFSQP